MENKVALRGIWLAIIVLTSLVIGVVAGIVLYALGAPPIAVVGAPGAVFVGLTTVGLNVLKLLLTE